MFQNSYESDYTLSGMKEMRESVINNSQQRTENHAPLVLADPDVFTLQSVEND